VEGASRRDQGKNVPDALRKAVERTFAATAESAAQSRDRAGEVLDEVARRGREARDNVSGRTREARESSSGAAARVIEAIEGMRLASREDVKALSDEVAELSRRVSKLEAKSEKPKGQG
jgi:polyhydroxyalkanoate synthesis regulator phasin